MAMPRPVQERPGRRAVPALPRNAAAPSGSGRRRRVTRPPQAARDRSSTKNHAPQQQSTKNQLCYVAKIRIAGRRNIEEWYSVCAFGFRCTL